MRIATVATGGVGGFLAVRLARIGIEVACIARGAHLDAIRSRKEAIAGIDATHTASTLGMVAGIAALILLLCIADVLAGYCKGCGRPLIADEIEAGDRCVDCLRKKRHP